MCWTKRTRTAGSNIGTLASSRSSIWCTVCTSVFASLHTPLADEQSRGVPLKCNLSIKDVLQILFCIVYDPFTQVPAAVPAAGEPLDPGTLRPVPWYVSEGRLPDGLQSPSLWSTMPTAARLEIALMVLAYWVDEPAEGWDRLVGSDWRPKAGWKSRVRSLLYALFLPGGLFLFVILLILLSVLHTETAAAVSHGAARQGCAKDQGSRSPSEEVRRRKCAGGARVSPIAIDQSKEEDR